MSLRSGLAVGALATGLILPSVTPIVRAIFQYGAFSPADTETVAGLLALFSLSIPFWAMHQVSTRAFYAQQRMWLPVIVGTLTTAFTIPVLFYLTDRHGGDGIAAGSTFGVALYAMAITTAWLREGGSKELTGFAWFALKVAVAATIAGAVSLTTNRLLEGPLPVEAAGLLGGAVAGLLYLVLARVFAIDEVWDVVTGLIRRLRRSH